MADEGIVAEPQYMSMNGNISKDSEQIKGAANIRNIASTTLSLQINNVDIDPGLIKEEQNTQANSRSYLDHVESSSMDKQVVLVQANDAPPKRIYWPGKSHFFRDIDLGDGDDEEVHNGSDINHAWSRRILQLVVNKSKLMESFSWLSTVGGGYSSLGENDCRFSSRAGALSLGQQLKLAELLGDERLRVMCHLFAALAALQMNNKRFCLRYIRAVILPLMNEMPYRDPLLTNILRHICFRMSTLDRFNAARRQYAIEASKRQTSDGAGPQATDLS